MNISNKEYKPSAALRQVRIREMLADNEQVTIGVLAERFHVSEMTIRRDLDKLELSGRVRRTHGGAMVTERMIFEFDFHARRRSRRREKQAIAREALKLIQPGRRIILDTGTTTLELAELLKDYDNLTVITPSLAVASLLQYSPGIQTVLLGGMIRQGSPDLAGLVTENNLDLFMADLAFLGADGIGPDGTVYNDDMRIAKTDRKIRQRSERTYILADSSKIGRTALITNCMLQETDGLIIDDQIKSDDREKLEKIGIKVIIVPGKKTE